MIPNPNYEKDTDRFLEYAKEMWKAGVISEKRFRTLSAKIKCWWFDQRSINLPGEETT